jgi:hypothetical protein
MARAIIADETPRGIGRIDMSILLAQRLQEVSDAAQ